MNKKIVGLFIAGMLLVGGGLFAQNKSSIQVASADQNNAATWINNYKTTSVSGQTYTGTAIELSSSTTTLPGVYTLDDLKSGFLFQITPDVKDAIVADHIQVVFRDSVDSTQVVAVYLRAAEMNGQQTHASISLTDQNTRDGYGYVKMGSTNQAVNTIASPWGGDYSFYPAWGMAVLQTVTEENTEWSASSKKSGYGDGYLGIFGASTTLGNTTAVKMAYNDGLVTVNGIGKTNIKDADYLTKNVAKLDTSDATQKAFADLYTQERVNNMFSSGKVTIEFSCGATYNGSANNAYKGKVNVISVGSKSLANMVEDTPPTIAFESVYYDKTLERYVFDKDTVYDMETLAQKLIVVSDNVDPSPNVVVEVYNARDEKYADKNMSFSDGDYFKFIVTDCNGNVTTVTSQAFHLTQIELPKKISVELETGAVRYGVLTTLPSGYGYTTALFEKSDSEHKNPLTKDEIYVFEDIGEYVVAFNVYNDELSVKTYYVDMDVVDNTAPTLYFENKYADGYSINEEVSIIYPTVKDNNKNGQPQVSVKAYFQEREVSIINGKVLLSEIGAYEVEYIATDKSGNVSTERLSIVNTGKDALAPQIQLSNSYAETAKTGEKIAIVSASVTDNFDVAPTLSVEVVLNGKVLSVENDSVTPQESGTMYIIYTASDASGNQSSKFVTIKIEETTKSGGRNGCGSSIGGHFILGAFSLGICVVVLLKKKSEE